MSFRHNFLYTITAKRSIYECGEIDSDFADLLFTDVCVYRNPELISNRLISDEDHELSIKLIFLCDMRQEYNEHFFGGNAPITEEFFDKWWTLVKSDEAEDVGCILKRIHSNDFGFICSQLDGPMFERLREFRDEHTGKEDGR